MNLVICDRIGYAIVSAAWDTYRPKSILHGSLRIRIYDNLIHMSLLLLSAIKFQGLRSTVAKPSLQCILKITHQVSHPHLLKHYTNTHTCLYFNSPVLRPQEGHQKFWSCNENCSKLIFSQFLDSAIFIP